MVESIQDLREIQSLTSSIAKTYDNINTSSDRRNRKIQQEVVAGVCLLSAAGGAAIAAGAGMVLGAFIVGAAVAYGTCKLIEWAFK
jgi:hypothetical protein